MSSNKNGIRMSNGKFVCEFCKNEYKTLVSLRNHQLRATFCKHIRGEPVVTTPLSTIKNDSKNGSKNDELIKELRKKVEEQTLIIKKLEEELKQYKMVEKTDSFEKNIVKKLNTKLDEEDLVTYLIQSNILLTEKLSMLSSNKNSNKNLIKKCVDWFKLDVPELTEKELKAFFTNWEELINEMYNLDVINDGEYDENSSSIESFKLQFR